ncbi:serine/arginine-rich splicing factor 4 [Clonorchis sinensis]|uniref:Serine/arginine-rich splicing factor 4 n=1 Tax=Clonorchis sinensis TaxID=79923 RepID=G7YCK5_CLOSI|nr:serine/arginine-rich splicing factor 4 [Clonorchis sinensis]
MSRVYIGHLPARCSERDIERFFKGYGRLRDVVLKNGYGFVEFDNEKDADDAVYDLHGRELRGERIIVEHARLPPGSRGGSRRSGGGRDRVMSRGLPVAMEEIRVPKTDPSGGRVLGRLPYLVPEVGRGPQLPGLLNGRVLLHALVPAPARVAVDRVLSVHILMRKWITAVKVMAKSMALATQILLPLVTMSDVRSSNSGTAKDMHWR